MEQQATWFYYAIVFVVGVAAGSLTLAASPQAAPQTLPAITR